jgi:hypothetical protein
MKDPLCDVNSQYANMVFHWTRLLWLNGFTRLEIILAHYSRSAQGAGPFHYDLMMPYRHYSKTYPRKGAAGGGRSCETSPPVATPRPGIAAIRDLPICKRCMDIATTRKRGNRGTPYPLGLRDKPQDTEERREAKASGALLEQR